MNARSVQPRVDPPRIPEVTSPTLRDRFALDVLLVNPPSPNRDPYIRDIHRVGRNSREGTIWPQTSLAQLAAMFPETTSVRIVDCIAERMPWSRFEQLLLEARPRIYITHATAPTLTNDMRGAFLVKAQGATTVAIGTHVSPATAETLRAYPALDIVVRGEPEETVRELVAVLLGENPDLLPHPQGERLKTNEGQAPDLTARPPLPQGARPKPDEGQAPTLTARPPLPRKDIALRTIQGIAYRHAGEIVINPDRPFVEDLDSLPIPRHELLPLDKYKLPFVHGRYTFVVTSRGCPAGCIFCIKQVTYQNTFRLRSPEHIMQEVSKLVELGTRNIHFEADLFTLNREQVVGLCNAILEQRAPIRWTCNSRVDFVDEPLLQLMGRAGCWMISWGIESGSAKVLKRCRKGIDPQRVAQALRWAKAARIRNWGYFILGLPGETEETIEETIAFSKALPLDLALFHIAVPYPGTPFWFEALEHGWLRMQRWEDFDMYNSTVVEYSNLTAEELAAAARRAARSWSLRPGPIWTFLKELRYPETASQLLRIGARYLRWIWQRD